MPKSAALAAIDFALKTGDPTEAWHFLQLWYEGGFTEIRESWHAVPEDVFIGADPLYEKARLTEGLDLDREPQ